MKKTSKIIGILLLSAIMVFSAFVMPAIADTDSDDPSYKTSGDYRYEDNGNKTVTIVKYTGTDSKVTIPGEIDGKKVTCIAGEAFQANEKITSVSVPNGVTRIESYAFDDCDNLEKVYLSESVVEIEDDCFLSCDGLTEINVESKNKKYSSEDGVLYNKDVTALEFFPRGKVSAKIPKSVTNLGEYPFGDCRALKSIELPEKLTEICEAAFYDCESLESIKIPDKVTEIGGVAFSGCKSLKEIELPEELETIGDGAFTGCESLESINIPDSVEEISGSVFSECTGLKEINVGSDNEYYSSVDGILYDKDINTLICCPCKKSSVEIPDSVTGIGDYGFSLCAELRSISLPEKVKTIGQSPFIGCSNLTEIKVDRKNNNFASIDGVLYNKDVNELICCPGGIASVEIPESVTSFREGALTGCVNITEMKIPEGIAGIAAYEFQACTSLKKIELPDSVTSVHENAFDGCIALEEIIVSSENEVYSTYDGALFNKDKTELVICPLGKTSVEIPESMTYIDPDKFAYYSWLTEIKIDSKNKNYAAYDGAVYDKKLTVLIRCPGGKTSVNISDNAKIIGGSSLCMCYDLKTVKIPEGVTSIEANAFAACMSLESIEIPKSVEFISYDAFAYCSRLTDIYYGGTQEEWENLIKNSTEDGLMTNTDNITVHCSGEKTESTNSSSSSSETSSKSTDTSKTTSSKSSTSETSSKNSESSKTTSSKSTTSETSSKTEESSKTTSSKAVTPEASSKTEESSRTSSSERGSSSSSDDTSSEKEMTRSNVSFNSDRDARVLNSSDLSLQKIHSSDLFIYIGIMVAIGIVAIIIFVLLYKR